MRLFGTPTVGVLSAAADWRKLGRTATEPTGKDGCYIGSPVTSGAATPTVHIVSSALGVVTEKGSE